jgi:hypothetical protein
MGILHGNTLPSSCSIRYPIMPSVCVPSTSSGYAATNADGQCLSSQRDDYTHPAPPMQAC